MKNDTVANNGLAVAKREFRLIITFISMYVVFLLGIIPVLLTPVVYITSYLAGRIYTIAAITLFVMSSTISPIFTLKLRADFKVPLFNGNNDQVSKKAPRDYNMMRKKDTYVVQSQPITS